MSTVCKYVQFHLAIHLRVTASHHYSHSFHSNQNAYRTAWVSEPPMTYQTWYLKLTAKTPSERCKLNETYTSSDNLAYRNTAAYQPHANSLTSIRVTHDWGGFIVGHRLSLLLRYVNKQKALLWYWNDARGDPEMTKCQHAIWRKKRNAMSKTWSGTLTQLW